MRMKTFLIPIEPVAWKRPGLNYQTKRLYDPQKEEKLLSGIHFVSQMKNELPFSGPVAITCYFFMKIPASKRKRRPLCSTKPDIDNLQKYYFDVLTDCKVLQDDCLICESHAFKIYDKNPRVEISISELELL